MQNAVQSMFAFCSKLKKIVMPSVNGNINIGFVNNCTSLEVLDFGSGATSFSGGYNPDTFRSCENLKTIILRRTTSIVTLAEISRSFYGTPFDNGGSGGDIYIPEALYDHLGDGTALDYKAATNWTVLNGYGTITWHQIEGSIYETEYADGTAVE